MVERTPSYLFDVLLIDTAATVLSSWALVESSNCESRLLFYQLSTNYSQPFSGGIAQLVERQLCKLEVRGSNPLASILLKWSKSLTNRGV
jgi:hypothetical protein